MSVILKKGLQTRTFGSGGTVNFIGIDTTSPTQGALTGLLRIFFSATQNMTVSASRLHLDLATSTLYATGVAYTAGTADLIIDFHAPLVGQILVSATNTNASSGTAYLEFALLDSP